MSKRIAILGGVALLAASVPGCGVSESVDKITKESAEWRKKAEDLDKQLTEANKQIGKFSENMEKAAGAIDPLAIKGLLKKNESLESKNAELEKLLANPPTGHLLLSGNDLRLDIHRVKGEMLVECTIDSPENLVLRESLRATEPSLAVDYSLAKTQADRYLDGKLQYLIKKVGGQLTLAASGLTLLNILRDEIFPGVQGTAKAADDLYKKVVTEAFTNFLKKGAYETPTNGKFSFYLENRFKTSGKHALQVAVKPTSPDWEVTVELYQIERSTGKEKLLIRSQYNRPNDPNPANLPPIYLDVKYQELKASR